MGPVVLLLCVLCVADRQDTMGKIGIFKHMNLNHAAYILRHMTPLYTLAGNYIYNPAHGSDGVYFLLVGAAEVGG